MAKPWHSSVLHKDPNMTLSTSQHFTLFLIAVCKVIVSEQDSLRLLAQLAVAGWLAVLVEDRRRANQASIANCWDSQTFQSNEVELGATSGKVCQFYFHNQHHNPWIVRSFDTTLLRPCCRQWVPDTQEMATSLPEFALQYLTHHSWACILQSHPIERYIILLSGSGHAAMKVRLAPSAVLEPLAIAIKFQARVPSFLLLKFSTCENLINAMLHNELRLAAQFIHGKCTIIEDHQLCAETYTSPLRCNPKARIMTLATPRLTRLTTDFQSAGPAINSNWSPSLIATVFSSLVAKLSHVWKPVVLRSNSSCSILLMIDSTYMPDVEPEIRISFFKTGMSS